MPKPTVGITLGDPAGIGPEIVAKALSRPLVRSLCRPIVFGNIAVLRKCSPKGLQYERFAPGIPSDQQLPQRSIPVIDIKTSARIRPGKHSAASGDAALAYLDCAIEYAMGGEINAIVTAPLSKAAVRAAGISDFTGHTEYLAMKSGARSAAMMFYGAKFMVALVTTHLPLREVADAITPEKILDVVLLSHAAAERLLGRRPRMGAAGLNPHAGEGGALGDEDLRIVAPAVQAARRRKINIEGPVPADVLFRRAYRGEFDLVVAMYHDQALAPFKMVSFEHGVNITLGLPFVRTSVDHGTAADIAGKGKASEQSLIEAIKLAVRLVR
ncbi:MAG: 4-hydroxythreonine-4-phosphate dehydrogenase PdxA [Candidatus Abyssobacteria bacterium SURF_5]|uniref:4-hydroxythreonine-4-phosphate dehydrogenase PdxA n=1 Tax=Abyssobacteria bacterium (strain SURF_5) TaxID=2093360 RepID=A0A3A4P0C5_ABYX5|nr:MAG: 4-hydroxythreonine-4-phosphate dehydrogenase PdxA [Candidatus Abyssubacteria bacterium SURF_5]